MAFTVQNDDGTVVNANAYIEVSFLDSWLDDIGAVNTYETADKQKAIVQATRFIDSVYRFAGQKVNHEEEDDQTTEFPREDNTQTSMIYLWLKRSTAEYAKFILENGIETLWNNQSTSDLGIVRAKEKVADIETDYSYLGSTGSNRYASVPIAEKLIYNSGWIGSSGVVERA